VDEDNQYTLLIIETVPEDSGTYECVAINNSGEARCESSLVVQPLQEQRDKPRSQPSGKEQAPTITQPLSGQVIPEGQPVTFSCKISGQPRESRKYYFWRMEKGTIQLLNVSCFLFFLVFRLAYSDSGKMAEK